MYAVWLVMAIVLSRCPSFVVALCVCWPQQDRHSAHRDVVAGQRSKESGRKTRRRLSFYPFSHLLATCSLLSVRFVLPAVGYRATIGRPTVLILILIQSGLNTRTCGMWDECNPMHCKMDGLAMDSHAVNRKRKKEKKSRKKEEKRKLVRDVGGRRNGQEDMEKRIWRKEGRQLSRIKVHAPTTCPSSREE